ncbi:UDP-3-O-(3-hydroxymyristoyl)glucosamine N-acyltransferase [Desulfovibrio sp. OttesenSCG-928-A18]|nr:UDP-3-O-(3-hydroxymyristoyl)glucosamine N-acyltransferase [Desulfovibrio sp. OttesenSCG-928-A18]
MLLSELAGKLGLELTGEDREFSGLNTLEAASESEVSFLANPRYTHFLDSTRACAVIVAAEHAGRVPRALISANPYLDFARASALFVRRQGDCSGVSPLAVVHPSAEIGRGTGVHPYACIGAGSRIGENCLIFPGVYVGEDCLVGDNCILYPNSVLLAGVSLGDDCVLHSGAVIGTDGFGFAIMGGQMRKIPQIGSVCLEKGVDVGANTCIDRATLGATRIGADSKLDNLVQIGHNVSMGEQCLIISQVGIAGSTKVGDRVTMAGQAGISGHINIGDDVTIGPKSGVPKDIPAGTKGSGSPFMEGRTFLRTATIIPKLPEIYRRMQQLEKEVEALRNELAQAQGPDGGAD